jgi:TM2 domain-containing membrane protein YozV
MHYFKKLKSMKFVLLCVSFVAIAFVQMSMALYSPKMEKTATVANFANQTATKAIQPIEPISIEPTNLVKRVSRKIQKAAKIGEKKQEARSQLVAFLLCLLIGVFGAHRFYTGHYGIAILQLLTFGCCGIFTLVDLILILTGSMRDAQGQPLIPMGQEQQNNNRPNPNNNNTNGDFYGS